MSAISLQGNLDVFKLPDVLKFLQSSEKTGMLTLTRADRETYIFFRAGQLVYAASNADSVQKGMPSEEQLKVRVSEVIYDAFLWKGGGFAFRDGIDLPPKAVTITIDLSNLIMEGARRIKEWEECLRLLPDSAVIFRAAADPEAEKITLSLDEWKILFLINGQRTIEDLCRDSESDALRVYRVVYGLHANKLIEPAGSRENLDEATGPVPAMGDATLRESHPDFDATVPDLDDTRLLIDEDATLSFRDVIRKTVARLLIMDGGGTVVPLIENEYRIGRQLDNQIQLNDLGVSGHHARIFLGPDGYSIEDLKSRNGTWVNGRRVQQATLRSADEIRVGSTDLRYEVLFDSRPELTRSA